MMEATMNSTCELLGLIPDLRRLSRRLVRDPDRADDLAQEALLRVWAQMAAGAEIDNLRPYLMESARNLARRPARQGEELNEADMPVIAPEAPGKLAMRDVAAALARLPKAEASMILDVATGSMSYADLAARSGLPLGTVMSRLSRSRARLRKHCGLPKAGPVAALLSGDGPT
jgi:RNA polymerase sigma-70 factor (ECF subfamily)